MDTTIPTTNTATKWVLDPVHSELVFKVKHLMISNVKGEFTRFEVDIKGEDLLKSAIVVNIDATSITTHDENRDGHLRSADFFDVERHPHITFTSTSFTALGDDQFTLKGSLTIRGITQPVTLDVEFGGISKDPWGNQKAGYSFTGKINRKDWGLNWNAALEAGGVLVSDEVKIAGEVQLIKQ